MRPPPSTNQLAPAYTTIRHTAHTYTQHTTSRTLGNVSPADFVEALNVGVGSELDVGYPNPQRLDL